MSDITICNSGCSSIDGCSCPPGPQDKWSHRGWSIDNPQTHIWMATGPNYDASWEGEEDGWVDNGEVVTDNSREFLIEEIDAYIEAHGE